MIARGLLATLAVVLMAACSPTQRRRTSLALDDCLAPIHYVALGDSTVEGIGASHSNLNYVSRLHARLRARDRHEPNDITRGIPVAQYQQHMNVILGRLRRETTALSVMNLLPDLTVTPSVCHRPSNDRRRRSERTIQRGPIAEGAGIRGALVDLYLPSREEVPAQPALLWKDRYHPSDAGYARWAELMWEAIEPRLPVCRPARDPGFITGLAPDIALLGADRIALQPARYGLMAR